MEYIYVCYSSSCVHLGKDYTENLRSTKNQPWKCVRQLFQTTERLIKDQTEIIGLSTIDWKQPMWRETCVMCDRVVHIANSKTCVFADSVLCLGSLSDRPVEAWKTRSKRYLESRCLKVWIESTGSRWSSSGKISQDSQQDFASMYNDMIW